LRQFRLKGTARQNFRYSPFVMEFPECRYQGEVPFCMGALSFFFACPKKKQEKAPASGDQGISPDYS